jgi:hypothetical protein
VRSAPPGCEREPDAGVPLDVLRDTIQPFPTFSEIYVEALTILHQEVRSGKAVV